MVLYLKKVQIMVKQLFAKKTHYPCLVFRFFFVDELTKSVEYALVAAVSCSGCLSNFIAVDELIEKNQNRDAKLVAVQVRCLLVDLPKVVDLELVESDELFDVSRTVFGQGLVVLG